MLRQAAELAEAAGDLDLAWQAFRELGSSYAIDAISLRQQLLVELGKGAKSPEQVAELAHASCRLLTEALAAGQPPAAKRIASQAQSFAKRAKDAALIKEIGLRTRDAAKLATEFDAATAAREKLKTEPDDPSANFVVGHYELCAAGDWPRALAKLAKGSDANWQKPAKDDLELSRNSATAQQRLALGDAWLALAEKEPWPGRHFLRMRAGEWYRRDWASLVEKDRALASERLKKLLAEDDGLPAWELFDIVRGQNFGGYVRLHPGGYIRTPVAYGGPIEVSFQARTDKLNVRLYAHLREAVIWNWELNPRELRVTRADGELRTKEAAPLEPNRWYSFRYVVTRQGTTITVDGATMFSENHAIGKFPPSPVGVQGGEGSIVDVKNLVVKPL